MRQEGHIGTAEAVLLVSTVLTSRILLPLPTVAIQMADSGAWLMLLLEAAWAAVLILGVAGLLRRFPGEGLAGAINLAAGPLAGMGLNLLLVGWLVLHTSLILRLFAETFIVTVLPRTPPSAISLTALAVAVYAGYLGLETLARANFIIWPLTAAAFLAVIFLSMPQARLDWLFPLLGRGPGAVVLNSLTEVGMQADVILLAIYAYALRGGHSLRRAAVGGLALAGTAQAISVAAYVATFGSPLAASLPFPFYELARMIYLGRFFQRAEAFFVLFWILGALMTLAILLHATAAVTATGLALPYYRPLLIPLAVLIMGTSLVPEDFAAALASQTLLARWSAVPAFLLPLGLLALTSARRRGVHGHEA